MDVEAERAYQPPFVNSSLFAMLLMSVARQQNSPTPSVNFCNEYDYIVVGAGSAGSVVASRLSEMPDVSVLLLEAGKRPPLVSEIPGSGSFASTDIDWRFVTTPQKNTGAAIVNRQMVMSGGKVLGGSSSLNGMLSVRGNRRDYDDWAKAGAKGWSYDDCLPYFKKLEDNRDAEFVANGYHGTRGPVTISRPNYISEFQYALEETIKELGYPIVDSNGPTQTGFTFYQASIRDGQRCSTAKAYLVPAENRKNLDILIHARVKKVLIRNFHAYGVEFDYEGATHEVYARKEVIMSAGAIHSPQLLMLSGIGPRKELEKFNIPVIVDLPVGYNLQDHVSTIISYVYEYWIPPFGDKLKNDDNIRDYIHYRSGPLASTSGNIVLGFLPKHERVAEVDSPDFQLYFREAVPSSLIKSYGFKQEVFDKIYGPYLNRTIFSCNSANLRPRSRGFVRLRSSNVYDMPEIDPMHFQDPLDIDDIVQGMMICDQVAKSPTMRNIGIKPFETVFPGCENYIHNKYAYYECQVRSFVRTHNHVCGTAKMGDPSDPTTVVDSRLRVKNIRGLRVIDASVMPSVTSGNTNIPTIMIAEKGSDMIKCGMKSDD